MTTGNVSVVGYRQLIEPPERGDCGAPDCRTLVARAARGIDLAERVSMYGKDVLLVARYSTSAEERTYIRVCAACDERRLRAWLADR